jgi:hypothetical protein
MLNRMHDIRELSGRFFGEIIDVTAAVQPDPERASDFITGHAVLTTPFNKYKLSTYSPHGSQPSGAPQECQSLGSVEFFDPASDTRILGARSDRTCLDIARHLGFREFTDRIAHARRALAEATPDAVKPAQAKLSDLVSRAAKWGVLGSVPMAPPTKDTAPSAPLPSEPHASPPHTSAPVAGSAPPVPSLTSHVALEGSQPFVGAPVIFATNPGEAISGMSELPALIVRVDGRRQTVSLLVFIDDSETVHRLNIPRRGSDAGNGRVHQHGCWDFNPRWLADQDRIRQLEGRVASLEKLVADQLPTLTDRIAAIESASVKTRRVRPPKPEGGEPDGAESPESEPVGKELELG